MSGNYWMRETKAIDILNAWDSTKQPCRGRTTVVACEVYDNIGCRSDMKGEGLAFTLILGWAERIVGNAKCHYCVNRMCFGREAPPGLDGASCRIRDVRLIEDPGSTMLLAVTPDLDTMRAPEARDRWSFANRSLYVQISPDDLKKMDEDILKEEKI